MYSIYDRSGNILRFSRSPQYIRRYLKEARLFIDFVSIADLSGGGGFFHIRFDDGSYYNTTYPSYQQMQTIVRQWRSLWGANLYSQGKKCGVVEYNNPCLW